LNLLKLTWSDRWCNGYRGRLECGRSWVQAPVENWHLLFFFFFFFFFGYGKPSTYWCLLSGACLVKCFQIFKNIQNIDNLFDIIVILCLSTKYAALNSKTDGLGIRMCPSGVTCLPANWTLFHWAIAIRIKLSVFSSSYKVDIIIIIISLKCNLFSTWYVVEKLLKWR
jgi:hypothetical protein